ncbi:hypothetical protein LTR94_028127, partial [Friedmanniomyces endolithicus]
LGQSAVQPDGVERLIQSPDPFHHADLHPDLSASGVALHRLGLSRAVGPDFDRRPQDQPRLVL